MNELRVACAPYKPADGGKGRVRVNLRTEEIAAAVDKLVNEETGSFARAAWHFHRGEYEDAIKLMVDANGGGGGVPGSAPPHRAAVYALRARCHLRRAKLSEARNDLSRAATAAGLESTSFAASAAHVGRHSKCVDEDAAYLVRLRARCDLLSVRVSKGLSFSSAEATLTTATATLETGGSTSGEASRLGHAEKLEVEEEIRLAEAKVEEKRKNGGQSLKSTRPPPLQRKDPPSSFTEYDARYRKFENSLSQKADGSVNLSQLPLPPKECSICGASVDDPPEVIKSAIRVALLRWHPDKAASLAHYFVATDREALIDLSASLTRTLIVEKRSLLTQ